MFSSKSLAQSWEKFFFEERPTEGMAIFRIIWMGLIFSYFLLDIGNIQDFYGPRAIISYETVKSQFSYPHLSLFNLFHSSYQVTVVLFILYGVSLFTSMIGLFTRYSLILAFLLMVSFHQRNIWLLSSSELLMRTITLYLIFSPCGNTLSIDAILGKHFPEFRKPDKWPLWSLRLIQIQVSVVYLWTFWHKLKGDTWIDGTAVYFATRLESMTNFTVPFLMDSLLFLKLVTWGTLILEFSLGVLVWFKEYRKPVILVGILFHFGIEYVMSIPFFELIMIALLMNFFTPEELKSFVFRTKARFAQLIEDSALNPEFKDRLLSSLRG